MRAEPTPDRWVILTIRMSVNPSGRVEVRDNTSKTRATGTTAAVALAALAHQIEAEYRRLASESIAALWPHEKRALGQLARFYAEGDTGDQRSVS